VAEQNKKAFVSTDEEFELRHTCKICKLPEVKDAVDGLLDSGASYREVKKLIMEEHGVKLTLQEISYHNHHRKVDTISSYVQSVEIDESEIESLTRSEALKRERVQNQVLAYKIRAILNALIETGKWAEIRPDYLKSLTELYKVATSEARLGTNEEFKQLMNEETDVIKELMRVVEGLKHEDENAD